MRLAKLNITASLLSAALLLMGGCANSSVPNDKESLADQAMVHAVNDSGVRQAIIAEHTLYPYQFDANGATLNDLGSQSVDVLAGALREDGGDLNVRRGEVSDALYAARLRTVVIALSNAGVDTSKVHISDGLPAGQGMSSEDVRRGLQAAHTATSQNPQQSSSPSDVQGPGNPANNAEGTP